MVNLNANVSGRVRTVENCHSHILGACQCRILLFYADIQIRLRHFSQCIESCLEVFFLTFQNEFEIGSQWVGIKCRNEDAFRLGIRVSHVIEAVRLHGKLTRAELARLTALTPQTVSNIVASLVKAISLNLH